MTVTTRSFMRELFALSTQQVTTLLFIARTLLAAFLAMWLSMRFGLDKPSTAMVTVIIVAQPQSGLVLAKSVYRALGTLIGCAATLLFVSLFAQQRELFIGAIALWVGMCAAGSAYFRDFKAYGFILSGYTACIIGFPSALDASATYDIALSRVSEVLMGILCAGVVADTVFPHRLAPALVELIRGRYRDFAMLIANTLRSADDPAESARRHAQLAGDILRFESLRASVYFESPEIRIRNPRLQQLNVAFMASLTSFHALERLLARQRAKGVHEVERELCLRSQPLIAALEHPPATAAEARATLSPLESAVTAMAMPAEVPALTNDDALEFHSGVDLLRQLGDELLNYTRIYASLAHVVPPPALRTAPDSGRFTPHGDLPTSLAAGARAALALTVVCTFWIASNWPAGAGAALIACIVCCFFAASPTPVLATRQMIVGAVLATLAAWLYTLVLLPAVGDSFTMLAVAMLPVMVPALWLAAQPATAGVGLPTALFFATIAAPQTPLIQDPAALLNQGLSLFLGMAAGGVAFSVLIPAEGDVRLDRLLNALRTQLGEVCTRPLDGLRARFESHCRDLQAQIGVTTAVTAAQITDAQNYGLSLLEIGHAIIDARRTVSEHTGLAPLRGALRTTLDAITRIVEDVSAVRRRRALHRLDLLIGEIGEMHIDDADTVAARRRLRNALHRLRAGLVDLAGYPEAIPAGAPHAA